MNVQRKFPSMAFAGLESFLRSPACVLLLQLALALTCQGAPPGKVSAHFERDWTKFFFDRFCSVTSLPGGGFFFFFFGGGGWRKSRVKKRELEWRKKREGERRRGRGRGEGKGRKGKRGKGAEAVISGEMRLKASSLSGKHQATKKK